MTPVSRSDLRASAGWPVQLRSGERLIVWGGISAVTATAWLVLIWMRTSMRDMRSACHVWLMAFADSAISKEPRTRGI